VTEASVGAVDHMRVGYMLGRGTLARKLRRAPHWLALLAMLVQLVASYGHIHPEDFDIFHQGHGAPMLAEHHSPSRAIGDPATADLDCPVCAAMQILGSSAQPEGVHLTPPLSRHVAALAMLNALWLTPPRHLLFNTRGPPLL